MVFVHRQTHPLLVNTSLFTLTLATYTCFDLFCPHHTMLLEYENVKPYKCKISCVKHSNTHCHSQHCQSPVTQTSTATASTASHRSLKHALPQPALLVTGYSSRKGRFAVRATPVPRSGTATVSSPSTAVFPYRRSMAQRIHCNTPRVNKRTSSNVLKTHTLYYTHTKFRKLLLFPQVICGLLDKIGTYNPDESHFHL